MPTAATFDATAQYTLTGIVRVLHEKSNDNWSRAKLETDTGESAWVVCKFGLSVGEVVTVKATFNSKFHSYDVTELCTPDAGKVSNAVVILKLIEYLDGVGKVKAQRLGEKFPELFEAVCTDAPAVAAACGAELRDVLAVGEQLKVEQTALGKLTQLLEKGWPNHLAKRAARSDSIFKVAVESPYRAIPLLEGLGWLTADEIGRKQGIAVDDPGRIKAGIEHWYAENVTNDGHTRVAPARLFAPSELPTLLGLTAVRIVPFVPQVLIPVGDWLTSSRHRTNAQAIANFFSGDR